MELVYINLARFDLISIRLAVLCDELGSLSAASKTAHCSLSTASYRLSALEQAVGKRLFTRDHLGLRATKAGALLVRHGKAILQHVKLMNAEVHHACDETEALISFEDETNPDVMRSASNYLSVAVNQP